MKNFLFLTDFSSRGPEHARKSFSFAGKNRGQSYVWNTINMHLFRKAELVIAGTNEEEAPVVQPTNIPG